MDTECQRCGYDNAGRYHVRALWPPPEPDRDQCPDCRAAPDPDHHPDCTMTVDSCENAASVCDSQSDAVETRARRALTRAINDFLAWRAHARAAEGIIGDCILRQPGPQDENLWSRMREWLDHPCTAGDEFDGDEAASTPPPPVDVPFRVQEWMFESLAPSADLTIAELIESDWNVILEMARDRFRRGYAKYGSNMYEWTARERLRNVLEELADAVVYLTSGQIK